MAVPWFILQLAKKKKCAICGNVYETNCTCEQGHYICDKCHSKPGLVVITAEALRTESTNPIEIAMKMMDDEHIHMHGPEHHYLVPAALLAAYYNAGGTIGNGRWQIVWVQLSYVPPKFPEGYAVLGDAAALQLVQGFLPALSPALLLCLMRLGAM